MNQQQLQELIDRYISDRCSPEDIELLAAELTGGNEALLARIMDQQLEGSKAVDADFPGVVDRVTRQVMTQIAESGKTETPVILLAPHRSGKWKRFTAAAAAVLILLSAGFFTWHQLRPREKSVIAKQNDQEPRVITPGKDGAILTLADGSTMVLDSLGNGVVATQNGSKVMLHNGQLVYDGGETRAAEIAINTITTPKGRQFRLQLEDGTKVWLNAASSLKYPAVFSGTDRLVEITGEAYFEVAKDAARPFHVKLNDETAVQVLGTHFNISSYSNEESIKTTLLEGSVRISSNGSATVLRPGQQAQVFATRGTPVKVLDNINTDRVVAWKNGVFNFENASLHEVMRQLERWYDIDVEYADGVQDYEFVGKMDRSLSLQDVLRGLEMSEVHFKIVDGRKIVVTP